MKTIKVLFFFLTGTLVASGEVALFLLITLLECILKLLRVDSNFTLWLDEKACDLYDHIMQHEVHEELTGENQFAQKDDLPHYDEIVEALLETGGWNIDAMMERFGISRHKINDISKWLQNKCLVLTKDKANKNRNVLSINDKTYLTTRLKDNYPALIS